MAQLIGNGLFRAIALQCGNFEVQQDEYASFLRKPNKTPWLRIWYNIHST